MFFKECALGDVVTFQRGRDLPRSKMVNGPYPVLGSNGIIGYHNEFTTTGPVVVVGRSGNVGKPFMVRSNAWAHNTSLYIKDFHGNDPIFIYYFLKTLNLSSFAGGSAVPTLNRNHINNIKIKIPENINDQKIIGNFLSTLDLKIETNNKIICTLESLAISNIQFNTNIKEKTVADYAEINPKRIIKKGTKARHIDMSALSTTNSIPISYDFKKYSGGVKFSNGDTLLARITPCLENGKAAFINILDKEEVAFGSTEFIVFHSKGILPNEFFYCLIKTDDFRKFIIKRLTGTSGRQRISADDVGKYPLPIFLDDQIKYFNKTLPLLFSCIASYGRQNSTLRRLQDALLDKLIYGEIRIQK